MGWASRKIRRLPVAAGKGSAVQMVMQRFPAEVRALRQRAVDACLVVVVDGDADGAAIRRRQLREACMEAGIAAPQAMDRVLICVPTWEIETWLAYLAGEDVDESSKDYPKLDKERRCASHAAELVRMCHERHLRQPSPESLQDACAEFRRLFP